MLLPATRAAGGEDPPAGRQARSLKEATATIPPHRAVVNRQDEPDGSPSPDPRPSTPESRPAHWSLYRDELIAGRAVAARAAVGTAWTDIGSPPPAPDAPPAAGLANAEPEAVPYLTVRGDLPQLWSDFCNDFQSVFARDNLLILLAAGGASYAVHETLDDDVAANTGRHANRWGKGQEFFSGIGSPGHHFAAIGGLYAYSIATDDVEMHELSTTLFNAVAITGISTAVLKAASGSGSVAPNGEPDPFGGSWPSGHTSSSFAVAAVLDEYYGSRVGIPAYILAGLVSWERIDDREHELSDVVFGAALGYVIGKTVARNHLHRFCGFEVQPFVDPATGASGVGFELRY